MRYRLPRLISITEGVMTMTHLKKAIGALIVLSMLFALGIPAFAAVDTSRPRDAHISFNNDGKLKILQVADIQDDEFISPLALKCIKLAIETEKPDLIVLTGDNIGGYSCKTKLEGKIAIDEYMQVFEKAGVPVAMVFGNHDDDDTPYTKLEQIEQYETYSCFIGCAGVVADLTVGDKYTINAGTYNIPVYESKNSDKVVYNIWCFDSGNYNINDGYGGYGYVLPEQIDWYVETSNRLKADNGGVPVPSLAFQHIVPPQIVKALKEVSPDTPGAIQLGGKYLVLPDDVDKETNWLTEAPCPPDTSFAPGYAQVDTMLRQGDVQAIFFGHDHINSFVVDYQGIDLVSSPAITFSSYNDEHRGFRVITLDKSDLTKYDTYTISASDLLDGDILSSTALKIRNFFENIIIKLKAVWEQITSLFQK